MAAFVHRGRQGCAETWTAEVAAVTRQQETLGRHAAGPVLDAELGNGSSSGRYAVHGSWGAQAPPGTYTVCAYLVGPGGASSTPLATASAQLGAAAGGGATVELQPYDLVFLDGAGLACYVFPHVFPENPDAHSPPGINCFVGRPGSVDGELGSAALFAAPAGRAAEMLFSFGMLGPAAAATCGTVVGCERVRRVAAAAGTTLVVRGEHLVCTYLQQSSLDPGGGPAVACRATTAVAGSSRLLHGRRFANARFDALLGVSGFFLDHRIAAGLSGARLARPRTICNTYATTCHDGVAG